MGLPAHLEGRPEGDSVLVKLPLHALPNLKGTKLTLDRYGDDEEPYTLSMVLAEIPDNIKPVLVSGKRALVGQLKLGGPDSAILYFEVHDIREAKSWLKFLQAYFKIDQSKVIDRTDEPKKDNE